MTNVYSVFPLSFQNFGLTGNEAYEHELRSSLILYSRDFVILKFQMHGLELRVLCIEDSLLSSPRTKIPL